MSDSFIERPAWQGRSFQAAMMQLRRPGCVPSSVELDITDLVERLRQLTRETRRGVSLTAFAAHTIAGTVEQHPILNSFRRRGRLITFDDIDLVCSVERLTEQERIVRGCILRGSQALPLAEISARLRQEAKMPLDAAYFARERIDALLALPPWVWRTLLRVKIHDAVWLKRHFGTMALTTLRYPGLNRPFVAFPPSWWTLAAALCPVFERSVPTPHGLRRRSFTTVAFVMDHTVVDGIDSLRACRTFCDRFTSGEGLDSLRAVAAPQDEAEDQAQNASPKAVPSPRPETEHADAAH